MIKVAAVAAAGVAVYLAASQPDRLVVSHDGEIQGIANEARALLQQGRFWRQQQQVAQQRLARLEQAVTARENPVSHLEQEIQGAKERAADIRADYPGMSGIEAMQAAETLRSMADAITESHWESEWAAWDREDLEAAQSTLRHIERRL